VDKVRIKLHRDAKIDPRCNEIVLAPMNYLCNKWNLPMGENLQDAEINLYYRFVPGRRPTDDSRVYGVLVDDLPEAYHPRFQKFIEDLKSYDFMVVPNPKLQSYLESTIGVKPILLYEGLCAKTYYKDRGFLNERSYFPEKRMAFIFHGGYVFDIDKFAHDGWKVLYFSEKTLHRNNSIIRKPCTTVVDFYKITSKFSPDIIVQGWVDSIFFYYKANLKFRESITFSSCLVAQDKGDIYHINHGINGFKWNDVSEFHDILDKTPIDKFREIGQSHKDQDRDVLNDFYNRLSELY